MKTTEKIKRSYERNIEFYSRIGENFQNLLKSRNKKKILSVASLVAFANSVYAQSGLTLDNIENNTKRGIRTVYNIAKYAIAVVLIIGLIFVVYAVINNDPRAKNYVIGYVIALIIVAIAYILIPEPTNG